MRRPRRPTATVVWTVLLVVVPRCAPGDDAAEHLAEVRDTLAEDTTAWPGRDSLIVEEPGDTGFVSLDSLVTYLTERGGSPEAAGNLDRPLRPPAWTVKEIEVELRDTGDVRTVTGLETSAMPSDGPARAFDRVEVVLDGTVGEYEVEYVPGPIRECGSGRVLEVEGGAWVEIDLSRARAHRFVGEEARATLPRRRALPGLERVVEVVRRCDFEGMVSLVLGVDRATPFRAFHLEDGARIVVDLLR